jgi:hypothetical protein
VKPGETREQFMKRMRAAERAEGELAARMLKKARKSKPPKLAPPAPPGRSHFEQSWRAVGADPAKERERLEKEVAGRHKATRPHLGVPPTPSGPSCHPGTGKAGGIKAGSGVVSGPAKAPKAPEQGGRKATQERDRLVAGVDPRAKLPKGFALWTLKLQISWLRSHQRKGNRL